MSEVFEWALIRVVPRVDRGEAINAGVIVYSKSFRYLKTRIEQAHQKLAPLITVRTVEAVAAEVPPDWFGERGADAYVEQLVERAPLVPAVIRL